MRTSTSVLDVLQRLVEGGDSVIVIEHNLDVIKVADYIIDLGPEGGDKGGTLVASGTPEEVAKVKNLTPDSTSSRSWLRRRRTGGMYDRISRRL